MGSEQFNPRMIFYQIIAIQSLFYFSFVSFGIFLALICGVSGIVLSSFFDFKQYTFDTAQSTIVVISLWTSLAGLAFLLPRVIERTRKCLDFVLTVAILHLLLTCLVSGFPARIAWWSVWTVGCVACTLLSEYLCLRIEQREIRYGPVDEEEKIGISTSQS